MPRVSIVCTLTWLSCLAFVACGGSSSPSGDTESTDAAATDSGSSKHHDASAADDGSTGGSGDDDPSGDDDDDDDDASVAADASTDATAPVDAAADAAPDADAAAPDAGREAGALDSGLPLPPGQCTGSFGHGLTNGYGRIDGILQAYVKPTATSCPDADSTHLILQIAMKGAIYEIAVNVLSDDGSYVLTTAIDHALPGPAYSEGWHTGVSLDYPTTLGVTSSQFTAYSESALVSLVASQLTNGTPITVYGHGYTTGAHDIHYYGDSDDGAIVLDPDAVAPAMPHWLLFHFDEQTF
jgi:hypothetical protein